MSIELSSEMSQHLEELAETLHTSKSDVFRKAIALIGVAAEAKKQGQKLYVSDSPPPGASLEIVGL
jgi:predicted transcriptional regulator